MDMLINTFQKKNKSENADSAQLHFHNGYELIFVSKGAVQMEIDSVPHKVTAPAVILLNPFEHHKITGESDDYARCVLVLNAEPLEQNISPRLIAMLKCRPQGFSHIVKPSETDFANICAFLNSIEDELWQEAVFGSRYIQNCVYNILIMMYRTEKIDRNFSSRMMQIQAYIDENYAHIDSIQEIADKFCVSLPHLSRSFKAYSGYSPVEYLKNTRLYHAQQLLLYSDYRSNEISSMVGFKEPNHFIRQFKNKFGISPQKFRKANDWNI
ncbi:MAG: helix-turn-helix domain-containing protein [Candidatus Fimenecus sp.]